MEEIRKLKRARSAAKGVITKKQNEIKELLLNIENIDTIKTRIPDLDQAFDNFRAAHEAYHANLTDECDIDESEEYFSAENTRVCDLKERINMIVTASTVRKPTTLSDGSSHYSSCSSSRSSSRKGILAKKAALKAQAALLKKRQKLQEEEFRLKQRMEQLELETELAMASAEVKAYNSDEISDDSESEIEDSDDSNKQNGDQKKNVLPSHSIKPKSTTKQEKDASGSERSTKSNQQSQPDQPSESIQQSQANSTDLTASKEVKTAKVEPESENALFSVISAQKMQTQHIENLLAQQQRHTLALTLPQPQVPTFDGNPTNYCDFIRSFENLIELKTDSDSSRLYYLVQYTSGDVQELMRSCLSMPPKEGYQEARRLLKQRYGQSYKIAASLINKLTESSSIKSESGEALQRFSTLLTSCRNTLKEIGFSSKIENPDTLKRIVDKLPYGLRLKWRDVADKITEKEQREITVDDLASFVEDRARIATHPIFGELTSDRNTSTTGSRSKEERNPRRQVLSFGTRVSSEATRAERNNDISTGTPTPHKVLECPSCSKNHWLSQCSDFRGMSLEERHKLVRSKGLCDNCLTNGHVASSCPRASFCKVDGCGQKHSTFLHPRSSKPGSRQDGDVSNEDTNQSSNKGSAHARNGYVKGQQSACSRKVTALPIVPVRVNAKGSDLVVQTYAFLDGGSNTTFCTNKLKEKLNARGTETTLSITTLEKAASDKDTTVINLEISALDGTGCVELPAVYSIANLPVSTESKAHQTDISHWPHFKDLVIPNIDAEVDLLIGSDVPQALQPQDVKGGSEGEPYAMKTTLGWAVVGPLTRESKTRHTSNFVQADATLENQFKQYCNMEFKDALYDERKTMSQEDKRALKVMEETVQLKNGHYELSLPWKCTPPDLDNNRCVALHRLSLLKKRLEKNPQLHQMYKEFVNKLLVNDRARKIVDDGTGKIVWYLPHHPVFHPKKPNKVRVVYDCSAKYKGHSLNSELLQGPDLTNSMIGVITRFREEPVALMADIESMFYQVRVTEDDRDALRFLWFKDGELDADVEEFQMNVHLFGGASSPSCANFARHKTAKDNSGEFSQEAVETVMKNFYVDDCLKSVATERAAIQLAQELRDLLAKGGFRLTKWMSNSPAVLSSIPEQERAPSIKNLDFDTNYIERALGIQWNVSSDNFGFAIAIKERPPTRRGILSIVSSIYDPLGFVAPFTLPAKLLLQDLCRQRLGWDDPMTDTHIQRWKSWLQDLPKLEGLNIRRCFKPEGFGEVKSSQLHHFSDASQQGYGAVTYLRLVDQNDQVHCSFVCGKSRLAPMKPITVPRMELSAAVLSTKLERMVKLELSTPPNDRSLFWTDSTCVLGYVQNKNKRFHTFVANRIAAIHDATSPSQWRYVDTASNPADEASRGLPISESFDHLRWIDGPPFLWQPESTWPKLPKDGIKISDNDPEVKAETVACATAAEVQNNTLSRILERFSSWSRLKTFVAWMLRLKRNLRKSKVPKTATRTKRGIEPLKVNEVHSEARPISTL